MSSGSLRASRLTSRSAACPVSGTPASEREVRARILGVRAFDLFDCILEAVGGSVRGYAYHEPHVEIARGAALRIAHAAARQAEPLPALASLRDLEPHGP